MLSKQQPIYYSYVEQTTANKSKQLAPLIFCCQVELFLIISYKHKKQNVTQTSVCAASPRIYTYLDTVLIPLLLPTPVPIGIKLDTFLLAQRFAKNQFQMEVRDAI